MLVYILFIIFWILLAAMWLTPTPHYSQFPLREVEKDSLSLLQTDWDAYHQAGKQYCRRLQRLFVALILVGLCADILLEARFENSARSSSALAD